MEKVTTPRLTLLRVTLGTQRQHAPLDRLCPNLGKASPLATPFNDPIAESIEERSSVAERYNSFRSIYQSL